MNSSPRLWTSGAQTAGPAPAAAPFRLSGRGARGRADLQRAHAVEKPVDHMWGARGDRPMSEDDLADVWARSLADLAEMQIEPHQRAWLQLTRPLGLVENTALIAAPNDFVKEQLETRLRALITNALSRELARNIQLAVTVDPAATADTWHPASRPVNPDDQVTGPLSLGSDGLRAPQPAGPGNGYPGHSGPSAGRLADNGPAEPSTFPAMHMGVPGMLRDPAPHANGGPAGPASIRSTRSRPSSSGQATGSRARPPSRSPRRPPRPITCCTYTATPGSAKPTCCTPSVTTRRFSTRRSKSGT